MLSEVEIAMSRTPARFTQADIARALRAVAQTGRTDLAVEIGQDGIIRIVPETPKPKIDELDREKEISF